MNEFINEAELKKAIAILKPDGQLFEVRVIGNGKPKSGYFTDADTLIKAFNHINLRGTNVYFTLNFIKDECGNRQQKNRFDAGAQTTSDADILGYQWMLVDLDPERVSGISSSNAELKKAADLGAKVYKYLQELGFTEPIKCKSGNGYHLLYRINLANTEENKELVHRCLDVLSDLFSNEYVKVDTVNYNQSRICKLYGTLAQKGADTQERPHRMSSVFSTVTDVKITDKVFLEKLASQLPQEPKPEKTTTYQAKEFDLVDFLSKNGIRYRESNSAGRDGSTIYALEECPFDCNHKDGDAKIFRYPDGAISFKCHHNSCSRYRWQDVREKFDPNAYIKPEIDEKYEIGWMQHNRDKAKSVVSAEPPKDNAKMFRTAVEILSDDEPEHEYIHSGITEIDNLLHGLQKQSISMISGLRASGKSTLIGNIILQAVHEGHTAVVYSGELSNKKYLNWLMKQAAGKNHVEVSTAYQNGVGVPAETQGQISAWMGEKFWLYNNQYGNNFKRIAEALRRILVEKVADICIIDNLMALDLSTLDNRDKYEAQTKFVWELKEIAMETNTHIVFVAHPKKVGGFIRLDDVSGTGNISNIVDNAFMVHRVNLDFEKRFTETFGKSPSQMDIPTKATNVIEIAKDRENGTMDYFIPLYFEPDTKRLRNSLDENIIYGWEDGLPVEFESLPDETEVPFE